MSVTLIETLMIKNNDWKVRLEQRIKNKISVEDIILRQLHRSPKTIGQLQDAIGHHRKYIPSRPSMRRKLNKLETVEKINTIYPISNLAHSLNCLNRIKYGLRDLIEDDLNSEDPESISYLSRETYFHNIKNRE